MPSMPLRNLIVVLVLCRTSAEKVEDEWGANEDEWVEEMFSSSNLELVSAGSMDTEQGGYVAPKPPPLSVAQSCFIFAKAVGIPKKLATKDAAETETDKKDAATKPASKNAASKTKPATSKKDRQLLGVGKIINPIFAQNDKILKLQEHAFTVCCHSSYCRTKVTQEALQADVTKMPPKLKEGKKGGKKGKEELLQEQIYEEKPGLWKEKLLLLQDAAETETDKKDAATKPAPKTAASKTNPAASKKGAKKAKGSDKDSGYGSSGTSGYGGDKKKTKTAPGNENTLWKSAALKGKSINHVIQIVTDALKAEKNPKRKEAMQAVLAKANSLKKQMLKCMEDKFIWMQNNPCKPNAAPVNPLGG